MSDNEGEGLRVVLRDKGRKVAQVWALRDDRATRLYPGEAAYTEAVEAIGLGRRRGARKKPARNA